MITVIPRLAVLTGTRHQWMASMADWEADRLFKLANTSGVHGKQTVHSAQDPNISCLTRKLSLLTRQGHLRNSFQDLHETRPCLTSAERHAVGAMSWTIELTVSHNSY